MDLDDQIYLVIALVSILTLISISITIWRILKPNKIRWFIPIFWIFLIILLPIRYIFILESPLPTASNPKDTLNTKIPIDISLDEFTRGIIKNNIPGYMKQGTGYTIVASIEKFDSTKLFLAASILDDENDTEMLEVFDTLRLTSIANVELICPSDDDFKITPISSMRQLVNPVNKTNWRWNIVPLRSGNQMLSLLVNAEIKKNGVEVPSEVFSKDQLVYVESSVLFMANRFYDKNWQFLWTAIAIPLIGYLFNRLRKKRKYDF